MEKRKFFRILFLLVVFAFFSLQVNAAGWKTSANASLGFTHNSFNNFVYGGQANRVVITAWNLTANFKADKEFQKFNFSSALDLAFGEANSKDYDLNTSTYSEALDYIKYLAVLKYKLTNIVNPFFSFELDSQFTDLFDPLRLTQALGGEVVIVKKENMSLKTRLGAAVKENFASDKIYPVVKNGSPTGELNSSEVKGGIQSVTDFSLKIKKNVTFNSTLDLFTAVNDFGNINTKWDNVLSVSLAKYLKLDVTQKIYYIYVPGQPETGKVQFSELTAIAFTYQLF